MAHEEHDERLKDCLTTVQHLKEENRQLRDAADSFGQLAERLNEALGQERRAAGSERRLQSREGPDRRSYSHDR
jgi:predicted RNase H-like nuclease (RuvC/YqgF family)